MRAKSMVLILIALGCGLVAATAISQVLKGGANSDGSGMEMIQIYVATSDIDVNEQLTASTVRVEDWPKTKVPEGAITSFEQIEEHFARTRLYEGEPILSRMLADEITGPAIKIPDGHRVCSINVQMDTAVSYLVKPGDRVDIFGYFKQSKDIPSTGTRQILGNVRVFAINSETDQETMDDDAKAIVAKTVSVLVKQNQVAKLMLATELGTLRLALRHPNETPDHNVDNETASIESLFGARSESADTQSGGADQLASKASGLVSFLSSLKQPAQPAAMAAVAATPRAAWQMTVLTPNGGEEFSWSDPNQLPTSGPPGSAPNNQPSRTFPAVDTFPSADAKEWQPAAATADEKEPLRPTEPKEQREEQDLPTDGMSWGDD